MQLPVLVTLAPQEDAKKMHAQTGKSDLDDPFKELADQK
jgi:hypothetical protein